MKRIRRTQLFSDKEYYNGWSEGENIVLLRREPDGKRVKEVHPFEWYFYVRRSEYDSIPRDKWDWLCRHYAKRVEPDPNFPDRYVRVYVDNNRPKINHDYIFQQIGDLDRSFWSAPYVLSERSYSIRFPTDRDRWSKIHEAVAWCRRKGVEPLEADLTPKQRFLTDYDLRIKPSYRIGFFDLETDDTVGGFENKEENRILSVAWEGDRAEEDSWDSGFLMIEEESDAAEREMLVRFRDEVVKRYDVISAWNGFGFDFPMIIYRFRKYGIRIDWRYHMFADPLPIFRRHYIRAGADSVSFALDSIGDKVLGMKKLDWRSEFRRKFPGVIPKIINLYRNDPKMLEEYNRRDVTILRKLEELTGFLSVERLISRIAGDFINDTTLSGKIDRLLLKTGFNDGHHFPTRYFQATRPEQYEGAHVFDPIVGMHENVASMDFKSLYPSMVRAFNISPETLVKREDCGKYAEDQLCRCPLVDVETEGGGSIKKGGSTFLIDKEGYISQMFVRTLERRKKYTDLQHIRLKEVGTTQDDKYQLYNRLAYSFKRLGLSFYGDMGNPNSRYYDTELAESITLSGRYFIKLTERYANENGMRVLYGDTDSIYVQLAPDSESWESEDARINDLVQRGEKFVAYCQERYLEVLKEHNCNLEWNRVELEFEDVFDRIFFVVKKRYAGRMLSHKGDKTDHVEVKGLEVMRSDCSGSTRKLQQAVLDAILKHKWDAKRIERELIEPEFEKCANGEWDVDEVSISKGLSKEVEEYKAKPLHVRLATDVKRNGHEYYVGMKIEYVITGTKPTQQGVLRQEYEDADGSIAYDAEHYWDGVTYPSSIRILEVCFPEHDWRYWLIGDRKRREKLVERYRRWLADPKRREKAVAQIRENSKGLLREEDLAELRRVRPPRVKSAHPGYRRAEG